MLLDLHGIPLATTSRAATARADAVWTEIRPRVQTGPASACRWSTRAITCGSNPSARRAASRRSSRWASPNSRASSTASWQGMRSPCSRSSWRSHAPSRTRNGDFRVTSSTSSRPGRSRPPTPPAAWPGSDSRGTRSSSLSALEGDEPAVARAGRRGPRLPRGRRLPDLTRVVGGRSCSRRIRAGPRGSGEGARRPDGGTIRGGPGASSLPTTSAGACARRATPCRSAGWRAGRPRGSRTLAPIACCCR